MARSICNFAVLSRLLLAVCSQATNSSSDDEKKKVSTFIESFRSASRAQ